MKQEAAPELAQRAVLVSIEGIDGTGKSTQVELLAQALRGVGLTPVVSREPTGGYWGRKLRESAVRGRLSLAEELQAFINDRAEHVRDVIQPALDAGGIVLLDRYYHSTIAYQGSRGGDIQTLQAHMEALFPAPDAVYLLDLDPAAALHRISHSRNDTPDEFEKLDALARVRDIFCSFGGPVLRINGGQPVTAIHKELLAAFVRGPLRAKRCAVLGGCGDPKSCNFARSGACQWWELSRGLLVPGPSGS